MKTFATSLVWLLFSFAACQAQDRVPPACVSPNRQLSVMLSLDEVSGAVRFSVSNHHDTVITPVLLGLKMASDSLDFTERLIYLGSQQRSIDERYRMLTGKRQERRCHCKETIYKFANEVGAEIAIAFRVFDDGIAYRYQVENQRETSVVSERSAFSISEDAKIWAAPYSSGDEGTFKNYAAIDLFENKSFSFPVLIKTQNEDWLLFTEANVSDYPLSIGRIAGGYLRYGFAPGKAAQNTVSASFRSPWRVIILGKQLGTTVESCLVDHLAPAPAATEDYSWVEPGVTSFPWWGDIQANSSPETLKKYIDLSATMQWPYVEFDVALVGSSAKAKKQWKQVPWIKDVVTYGKQRGVKCYGWDDFKNLDTSKKREDVFSRYSDLGLAGCKVDFINSYSQPTRRILEKLIQDAAKYKLLLSFHGAQSPRGFSRTYPHVMTYEAVRGSEYYLEINGAEGIEPSHNCILPFTRNVLGSMDYTPVAFSSKLKTTTMAHELALSVVFESGWQGLCDRPEAYLHSVARPFLTGLPAVWDESRFLSGYPGESCVIARRKGAAWYVAGISATEARLVSLDLASIVSKPKKVALYLDSPVASSELRIKEAVVSAVEPLEIPLQRNGGFAFIIPGD